MRLIETSFAICSRNWVPETELFEQATGEEVRDGKKFDGVNNVEELEKEDGRSGDGGFLCLQDNELTRLDQARDKVGKLSFAGSNLESRWRGREGLRWNFKGEGDEEDRSLSMASLSLCACLSL